jgi:hypothetical protein
MASWWHRDVIAPGKLPLMLCFPAFVTTFAVTRAITCMIRDGRGPFRNQVTASGTHIHHSVPGIILLIIGWEPGCRNLPRKFPDWPEPFSAAR